MDTVDSPLRLPNSPRRILPALVGMLLFGIFVFSMGVGAAQAAVEPDALGSITGTVFDNVSQPISGINVTIYRNIEGFGWTAIRRVETDDAGAYQFLALRAGIYRLHFRDPERRYAQVYYENSASLGGATDIPLAGNAVSGVNITLSAAGVISGVVSIVDGLAPDRGVVELYAQIGSSWLPVTATASLTQTGAYQFSELFSGTYFVCAQAYLGFEYYLDYFYGCYGGISVVDARAIELSAGETRGDINFQLGEGQFDGQISGRVSTEGQPLAGIKVSLYSYYIPPYPDPSYLPLVYTYTNAAGEYQLGGLQAGIYLVSFSDPGGNYTTRYYPDRRRADEAQTVFLSPGAAIGNIDANLQRAGAISGRIRYANGRGAMFAPMYLYRLFEGSTESETRSVETDRAGKYAVRGLEPGIYRICVPFEFFFAYPSPSWYYYPNCYGTDRFSGSGAEEAADISVVAGETTGGIDFTVGPALIYAPSVHDQ